VREGALLFGLCLKFAMESGPSLARAGFEGNPLEAGEALFTAMLERPYGVVFAKDGWNDVSARVKTPSGKIQLYLPDLLEALVALASAPDAASDASFPFVLSAGERRSFTANTIIRDPAWRKKDGEGALRIHPEDARALGVITGDHVKLSTKRDSAVVVVEVSESMHRGHVSLPNGLGLGYPAEGGRAITGVAPNELTSVEDRDPFVGTPWHKNVPARIERVAPAGA
jgi:anaerobic selenocysteine-containing dehydrogenase